MYEISLKEEWRIKYEPLACHPLLADINGDGHPETVFITRENKLKVYDACGEPVAMSRLPKSRVTTKHFIDVVDFPPRIPSVSSCSITTPHGPESRIMGIFPDGTLAMYTNDARLQWNKRLRSGRVSSPLFVKEGSDEHIIVAAGDNIQSLDPFGNVRWSVNAKGPVSSDLSLWESTDATFMLGGTVDNTIFSIGLNGNKLWESSIDGVATAPPLALKDSGMNSGNAGVSTAIITPTTERVLSLITSSGEVVGSTSLPGLCMDAIAPISLGEKNILALGLTSPDMPLAAFAENKITPLTRHGAGIRSRPVPFSLDTSRYLAYASMDWSLFIFDLGSFTPHPTRFKRYAMQGPITHAPQVFAYDSSFMVLLVENDDTLVMLKGEQNT